MDEQFERFESMKALVLEAREQIGQIELMTSAELTDVDNESARQAELFQRIQQSAGTVVQALTEVAEIARHARSYQAQAHSQANSNKPQ